ncbi:DUF4374 domain-containing protein [Myroides odoratimimus]|uniref:DUF4374 domain-containing protein n=1 Tax=Myroides odoratimimus TaxID=76832 RepID=UPI0025783F89|nr:DUF4374 domain-containing protein [Myroides odoratimimus]MDM1092720.1 DUF4374 domain-containing protein [Myroides odoratimimus]MDM1496623.1 DUF4374 domain-containing protein [Myroides odoratimimus]MDM1528560.1 DUF4374 domain-containing protein [Myroides odoratimimus]
MKKRVFSTFAFAMIFGALSVTSCSTDDNSTPTPEEGGTDGGNKVEWKYVIGASASKTNLLLTTNDLKSGEISAKGNGLTALGTTVYTYGGNRAYVFEYRKGDPSGMQSWLLRPDGKLNKHTTVDLPTREEFITNFGKYMIATTGGVKLTTGEKAQAFNFIDGSSGGIKYTSYVNVENIAEKGEYANFAGLETIGNDRFVMAIEPFKITKDDKEDNTSAYRDRAWLAVFKFDESATDVNKKVVLEKVVKSDKMSFAVARYRSSRVSTIGKAGDGNVYLFSPNATNGDGVSFSSKPSAVIKFDSKKGDFDNNYYFNLEQISGTKVYKAFAIGGDYFLLNMFVSPSKASNMAAANKLAVFNVVTGDFKWIEGLPAANDIAAAGAPFVDGKEVFLPITAESKSFVYSLDATAAKATKGLEIKDLADGSIGTIGKINVEK